MNLTIKILGIVFLLGIGTTNAQTYFHPYGTANISNLQNKGEFEIQPSYYNFTYLNGFQMDLNYAVNNLFFVSSSINYAKGDDNSDSQINRYDLDYALINYKQFSIDSKIGIYQHTDYDEIFENKNTYYNLSLGLRYGYLSATDIRYNLLHLKKDLIAIPFLITLGTSNDFAGIYMYYEYSRNFHVGIDKNVSDKLEVLRNELTYHYLLNASYNVHQFGFGLNIGYKSLKFNASINWVNKPSLKFEPLSAANIFTTYLNSYPRQLMAGVKITLFTSKNN